LKNLLNPLAKESEAGGPIYPGKNPISKNTDGDDGPIYPGKNSISKNAGGDGPTYLDKNVAPPAIPWDQSALTNAIMKDKSTWNSLPSAVQQYIQNGAR
jgi:hypothetical protein